MRAALVDAGLALLAVRDVEGLSLREVARTVGVSATAVYRHFPDKTALMAALAREGLDRLAAAQHAAADRVGGGSAGFAATGQAYVRFALANPALYRLIFASSALAHTSGENEALRFLLANAAANLPEGAEQGSADIEAVQAWALVHGLATLMLDGQLPQEDALIQRIVASGHRQPGTG
ncbi:TetR/AcrR family transcriptional regulator [Sphingomonas sp. PAMC 26617]|uniref:TetR/AcrR family transcriptional regulator n=1 Tax=Sphingomonas sp. PAMC 26617 TaxID=1112216 RepID=UPI001E5CD937|nr:TetR/AcrR family transcriptional regulator [Sphingomonas sp. PAMC 26617]